MDQARVFYQLDERVHFLLVSYILLYAPGKSDIQQQWSTYFGS